VTELERRAALALLAGGALGVATAADAKDEPPSRDAMLCPEVLGKFLRVARPGQAMTMDYRADRLTVEVDDKDRIVAIRAG
jgi:hypothetical protein